MTRSALVRHLAAALILIAMTGSGWASGRHRTGVLLETLFPLIGGTPSPGLAAWKTGRP